jgi:hypothetical protein
VAADITPAAGEHPAGPEQRPGLPAGGTVGTTTVTAHLSGRPFIPAWHDGAVLQVMALILLPLEIGVVLAPFIFVALLLRHLAVRRAAPALRPSAGYPPVAERPRGLSTGALATWLVISSLVLGSWIAAIVLTGGSGQTGPPPPPPRQPVLSASGLAGIWKTSADAIVTFRGNGRFTETALPGPPLNSGESGLSIPHSSTGTWQLNGSAGGSQDVILTFASGIQLDLTVLWQQVIGGQSYFILQPYLGSTADLNPAYELIRQTGTGH